MYKNTLTLIKCVSSEITVLVQLQKTRVHCLWNVRDSALFRQRIFVQKVQ